MEYTWRWYGLNDFVSLQDITQAGAKGVVNALHEVPIGEVWEFDKIMERKKIIENNPLLKWSVIESIPVHEDIKTGNKNRNKWIENYKKSIENVGKAKIPTLCYNFMPVLDWTRTNLEYKLPNGAKALRFDIEAVIAFDLFILKRKKAENEYTEEQKKAAKVYFDKMTEAEKEKLQNNIIAGLPGGQEGYDINKFREKLLKYNNIGREELKENLNYFIKEITPVAEANNVRLAIHPDDPPYNLFGLPRVVSTEKDINDLLNAYDSNYNGLTLCSGSLGVRADNNLVNMIKRFGRKINFVHLRNVKREANGSFHEATHLEGDLDMFEIMKALVEEIKDRKIKKYDAPPIPMRPDHGHTILDDLHKKVNPGYAAIGRLKGLAELRGLKMGIEKSMNKKLT